MLPQLEEIKERRENLGFTQKKFANLCDIKPAMLNMIEKGNAKPSYEVWVKLDTLLDKEEDKVLDKVKTAGQICIKNIKTVRKNDLIEDVQKIMSKKAFSQLPVYDYYGCVGLITENSTLEYLSENQGSFDNGKVKDAMKTKPPVIDWDYKITPRLLDLLYDTPCILVEKNNKIVGIITKIDAIKSVSKK